MWEFVKAGGWLMLPLVLCSVAMLTISVERYYRLRRGQIIPPQLLSRLLNQQTLDEAEQQALFNTSPMGQVFRQGYLAKQQGQTAEYAQLQMQTEASVQMLSLEKNINFLGTIGTISPLLGLLGTVLGIIEAFLAININGTTDPAMLANGVSKALITTAAGMIVAIPAFIAYRYFQRVVVELMVAMEQQATLYHNALFHLPYNHGE